MFKYIKSEYIDTIKVMTIILHFFALKEVRSMAVIIMIYRPLNTLEKYLSTADGTVRSCESELSH